jgi:very-short-patch-repair endonuclease
MVAQVGVAGFFIDLGVVHPKKPGAFILGVECDGATYHSGRSARDRDRIRQQALENLGWKIHRIWSTDWFKYREREVSKLVDRINETLAIEESEAAVRGVPSDRSVSGPSTAPTFDKEVLSRRLVQLRGTMEKEFPDVAAGRRLLRDPLLEVFLQKRPTSRAEWLALIPYELRSNTDLLEIRQYLPKVFEIFAE